MRVEELGKEVTEEAKYVSKRIRQQEKVIFMKKTE
jgi:hypothetical protein